MRSLLSDVSAQSIGTGIITAVVGYTSSVAVVIHGMAAVGASPGEIASGLAVLCLAMGTCGVILSLATRMPISIAWSTPGMALLATLSAPPGGFPAAVGAFVVAGVLVMTAGFWSPLGKLITAIPRPIAGAMLAGILFKLCLAPVTALGEDPKFAVPVILAWLVVGRFARLWAAPAALAVALAAMAFDGQGGGQAVALPALEFIRPTFDWQTLISIAAPLFVVTMASQNIPGLTVLSAFGYHPSTRPIFLLTGGVSAASAIFGAPTINLAAITAALCAGPDAHARPERRYVAGIVAGLVYALGFSLLAAVATSLVTGSSPILIEAAAGLALTGALGSSLAGAVQDEKERLPALATFLVAASGFSLFGIGAAFWGLCAGLVVHLLYVANIGATARRKSAM
ncbi:benzoate/H(+) symporter BenE family transporter [Labrys monachus]|uniref:Benzoate membrane transport protein n=1 Tax=Labrys monachus TaxID=217067 RepID=A0ABU0FHJ4_9HYPH|nr:benzoate/H(+) symporter BenE family transporter [Labrys monachus]MDQ0394057.1 benzoate membrane transport protein [Labrys monachus]